MSYLTEEEMAALQESSLDPWTPFVIANASHARGLVPAGFCRFRCHGAIYCYHFGTDELIREDVVKWVTARRAAQKAGPTSEQMEMGGLSC